MKKNIVEMQGITKNFPGVKALQKVDFTLKEGEVLALLGENGAGKSTLMKILSGIYAKDDGEIHIFGERKEQWDTQQARDAGIAIIHQELQMCKHLNIMENIFLGREIVTKGILNNVRMYQETKKVLESLGLHLDPLTIVGDLSISKQQLIEIAKALSVDAKILIMDEPTSALTSKEIEDLFAIIRKLKENGCGIVYISHRLEELQHIVDRVCIMRDGMYITDMPFDNTKIEEIIAHMVGRKLEEKFPRVELPRGEVIFEVKNLNAGASVRNASFHLHAGEIVGLAGLMGAGRTELSRAVFGVDAKDSGQIILHGKEIKIQKPEDAIQAGIVLVPEDRKKDGLCTGLSVNDNIVLPNFDLLSGLFGRVCKKKLKAMAKATVSNLKIKAANGDVNAGTLSGGNQQKIVVGKWLARDSKVVIFDEPTRGIDVAAKVEIYHLMNTLKQKGVGVLFISSEMPEIMGMSDRIIVMCEGRITAQMNREDASQDRILYYSTKFENKLNQQGREEGYE